MIWCDTVLAMKRKPKVLKNRKRPYKARSLSVTTKHRLNALRLSPKHPEMEAYVDTYGVNIPQSVMGDEISWGNDTTRNDPFLTVERRWGRKGFEIDCF